MEIPLPFLVPLLDHHWGPPDSLYAGDVLTSALLLLYLGISFSCSLHPLIHCVRQDPGQLATVSRELSTSGLQEAYICAQINSSVHADHSPAAAAPSFSHPHSLGQFLSHLLGFLGKDQTPVQSLQGVL